MEAKGFGAEPHFCIFIIVRFMTSKVCIQIKIFILKLNIIYVTDVVVVTGDPGAYLDKWTWVRVLLDVHATFVSRQW